MSRRKQSSAEPRKRKAASESGPELFQFKITLLDIHPPVWRRIQVPDGTLADLHCWIQAVFGWEDCHLHEFQIRGERFGAADFDGFDENELSDESATRLSELITRTTRKARWTYEYDFGDSWRHEILFEGFRPADAGVKYPLCLAGARACPPEDCGGPWGYSDFVAAVSDASHERHQETLDWIGHFDPEAFDPLAASRDMA